MAIATVGKRASWRNFAALVAALLAVSSVAAGAAGAFPRSWKVTDLAGVERLLWKAEDQKALVVVFLHPECPISNYYAQELNRIAERFKDREISFFGVYSIADLTRERAAKHAKEYDLRFSLLFDGEGKLATQLEPSHVPEAFVVDGAGKVIYRGRIDDQFASPGRRRSVVTCHDLIDAVNAILEGKPGPASTKPVGCIYENRWKPSKS